MSHAPQPDPSPNAPILPLESRSALPEKIPPDLRQRLDHAIINRSPKSFRAIYDRFNLRQFGVGFSALYHYARRLRIQASLAELGSLVPPDDADLPAALQNLAAARLLDALSTDDIPPRALQRLADIYRVTLQGRTRLAGNRSLLRHAHSQPTQGQPTAPTNTELCDMMNGLATLYRARAELNADPEPHGHPTSDHIQPD